jgi:hypothetical protein
MEAVSSSELSVKYHNIRRHIPEDGTLHVLTCIFLIFLPVSFLGVRVFQEHFVTSLCKTSGYNSQYPNMSLDGPLLSANFDAFNRSPHEVRAGCEVLGAQRELRPIKQLRRRD